MASRILLVPDKTDLQLSAGEADTVRLSITNAGPVVDAFELTISSIDPSWYTLTPTSLSLFPQDEAEATLVLHPPAGAAILAGSYAFEVVATSHDAPTEQSRVSISLTLAAVSELTIDIEPQRIIARKGLFTLTLNNEGNIERKVVLRPSDPEERLSFVFGEAEATSISKAPRPRLDNTEPTRVITTPDAPTVANDVSIGRSVGEQAPLASRLPADYTPPNSDAAQGYLEMSIPPSTQVQIPVTVTPAKRVWFGPELSLRFEIAATPPGVEWEAYQAKRVAGELVYTPIFSWWSKLPVILRRALMIAFPLLLLALLLFLLLRPTNQPTLPQVDAQATQTAIAQVNVSATLTALAQAGNNGGGGGTPTAVGSGGPGGTPTSALGPMRIIKFDWATAADGSLAATWEVTNAVTVTLNDKIEPLIGTEPVDTSSDRSLTLVADNGKQTVSRSLGVLLLKPPEITTFAANPPEITTGTGTVLSWETQHATDLTLDGNPVDGPKGSVSLQPTQTQQHTLVAKNDFGQVQSTTTITVTVPPTP
jgi:hypothetical protein